MLTSGRGEQPSAGCRVRCIHLVLLLEFLLFSIGTASPSKKEVSDSLVTIDNSFKTAPEKLRSSLNFHLHHEMQEFEGRSTQKDSFLPEVSLDSHSRPGLVSLLRRFVAKSYFSAVIDSRPVEKFTALAGSKEDSKVTSSNRSSNRRLEPGYSTRKSSSRRSLRALDQQEEQQIHSDGHRVLAEAVSSPSVPQVQVVHRGPPAPPDLLNNEKQDWNQDYVGPDVHPPSSN